MLGGSVPTVLATHLSPSDHLVLPAPIPEQEGPHCMGGFPKPCLAIARRASWLKARPLAVVGE